MNNTLPVVNAHNGWSRLEEVWLGDVYPAHWYDHLEPQVRDVFYHITEITKQDLTAIENKLKEFGVIVRRPCYDNIENHIQPIGGDFGPNSNGSPVPEYQLIKPEITPRDYYAVIGNTFFMRNHQWHRGPWQQALNEYRARGAVIDTRGHGRWFTISGANIVRAGRDLYIDTHYQQLSQGSTQDMERQEFNGIYANTFKDYRVHFLNNGGHVDACFACLKPGLILCNEYFQDYDRTFPGWQLIKRFDPEFHTFNLKYPPKDSPIGNQKWWLAGVTLPKAFNDHVIQHALDWVGDFTETYFEVNSLSIDENNLLVMGEHEPLFRELERQGITVHSVPFRTRTFWDGGLHCLTLDIRRQSKIEDYFPQRGDTSPVFY